MPCSWIDGLYILQMSVFPQTIYRFDIIPPPPNLSRLCVCMGMDDSNLYGSTKDQDRQSNLEGEHPRYEDLPQLRQWWCNSR